MTRYSQPSFDFYQQSPSSLEAKPAFSEDDEMSVLDDKILDPTTSPELSSIPDHRRSSAYDHPHDAFAHRDSIWSDLSQPLSSSSQSRHNSHVGHTMFDSSSNPFMRVDGTLPASTTATTTNNNNTIYAQQTPWSLTKESGSCTPNAMYDHFTTEFDNSSSTPFAGGAVGPVGAINMPPMSYRPSMAYATQGAVAMSPQSSHSWMPASTDMPEASSRPTKSPSHRHSSPLSVRRDGIRKKNARFEIPAERTLGNIESLIQNCRDDEEAKELKQQKRLLRNRQAA